MNIEQSAAAAAVRIGPVPLSWKQNLVGIFCGLLFASSMHAQGKPWVALSVLVLTCGAVVLHLILRTLSVDLTPEAAVIHSRRRRNVPWLQVQSVFNGTPFKPVIWRLPGVRMGKRVFGGNPTRELARPADPKPSPSTLAPAQVD